MNKIVYGLIGYSVFPVTVFAQTPPTSYQVPETIYQKSDVPHVAEESQADKAGIVKADPVALAEKSGLLSSTKGTETKSSETNGSDSQGKYEVSVDELPKGVSLEGKDGSEHPSTYTKVNYLAQASTGSYPYQKYQYNNQQYNQQYTQPVQQPQQTQYYQSTQQYPAQQGNYATAVQPTTTSQTRVYNYPTSTTNPYQGQGSSYASQPSPYSPGIRRQVGAYAQIGTGGIGLGITYHLNNYSNIRGEYNGFIKSLAKKISFTKTTYGGVEYSVDTKVGDFGVYYDYFTSYGSGMRLTGGIVLNQTKANLSATNSSAEIAYPKTALYLGVGLGHETLPQGNIGYHADLGVMVGTGKSSVSGTATSAVKDDIDKAAKKLKVVPVIRIGVDYDFL